jgi:D-sedoheptulose 7-phosphate isomerase
VTLSGFTPDNPLRLLGDINLFAPSDAYGFVEISHLVLCHAVVDHLSGVTEELIAGHPAVSALAHVT